MIKKTIVRVSRFGGPEVLQLEERTLGAVPRSRVRVRVTHVSVGSTDALARRGGYLLQPRPGFTPGYDLVGVVEESTAAGERLGLHAGMRVAGCLARMGSYATYVDVYPSHLVRVPDLLPSDIAAAVSLDVVTAGLALRLARLSRGGRLLVQGVAGAVGTFVVQGALQQDVTVFGTASAENRAVVEQRGVHFLNYRDANWMTKLREEASGMMDAAIDHTGANSIRSTVSPRGTVVRTAFAGRAGHELRDTATGSLRTFMRHFASPRERVCSVPAFVAVNPSDYRRLLSSQFERLTNGTLTAPTVDTEELGDVVAAHEKLSTVAAGRKLVLQMPTL